MEKPGHTRSSAQAVARKQSVWSKAVGLGVLGLVFTLGAVGAVRGADDTEMVVSHGYSFYGDLTYPEDFTHFDYVNPDAPKGGELSISRIGTFDSMNPYTRKGRSGTLSTIMYESLLGDTAHTAAPADVYAEYYCLLCERIEYPKDKSWVIFYMRKNAKFSTGDPVTAHDIYFSFNLLLEQGLQSYAEAVRKRIPNFEVIDDYTIKFYFADDLESRRSLVDQVGFVPAWSKKWYEETGARLDESRLEISPGSGPYMLEEQVVNRRIVYKRNPDYWGKDLPFNKGRANFDRIRIEYFGDDTAAFEGFKAGEYTFRVENDSKKWVTGYDFPKVEAGSIKLESLPDGTPPAASGMVFNLTQKEGKSASRAALEDVRVREALSLAFNFEWTNESLLYSLYNQRSSYSQDTDVMAEAVPAGLELELLQGLGDLVPAALFEEEVRLPHSSNAARLADRRNFRKAGKLLDEAGWPVGDDGVRRNAEGQTMSLTFLFNSTSTPTTRAAIESFVENVKTLGIDMKLDLVDSAQYTLRERDRDYDLVVDQYPAFLGTGTGLKQRLGSEVAAFSLFNPAGIASPLIDAVIEGSLKATSREEEIAWLTALDRVLRHEFIMIPLWFKPDHWTAYYNMYEHPEEIAPFGLGYLDYWWFNQEKYDQLIEAGALR